MATSDVVPIRQSSTLDARLEWSSKVFVHHIWPRISSKFGTGALPPLDGRDGIAKLLDYCGLDYLFDGRDSSGNVMYGISQRTNRSWPVGRETAEHPSP
jgi:hypothetical protein